MVSTEFNEKRNEEKEEPLLVACMDKQFSYQSLLSLVQRLDFGGAMNKAGSSRRLPPELALRIVQYFTIKPVNPNEVRGVGYSSCHQPGETPFRFGVRTGWMSAQGSMPRGGGKEFVELQLTEATACRLSSVSLKITPLPRGPKSVRSFRLEAPFKSEESDRNNYEEWKSISPKFTVVDRNGWQQFQLPTPTDVKKVRLVCLTNQIHPFLVEWEIYPDVFVTVPEAVFRHPERFGQVAFEGVRFA
jgi:hypothetical protein